MYKERRETVLLQQHLGVVGTIDLGGSGTGFFDFSRAEIYVQETQEEPRGTSPMLAVKLNNSVFFFLRLASTQRVCLKVREKM